MAHQRRHHVRWVKARRAVPARSALTLTPRAFLVTLFCRPWSGPLATLALLALLSLLALLAMLAFDPYPTA